MLVVGQSAWQGPASSTDAAMYKQSHGYQSGWYAVADPNWMGIDGVIQNLTGTLPNMSVLDGDMTLLHTSTSWSWVNDAGMAIGQAAGTTP